MLSPRLTNCPECANIPSLLKKIDCKLAELGNNLYNNISYMLNKPIPAGDILQLIAYRRILMHKYCNPNYVHEYSVAMIASRVIRLTLGCVSRCNELERCLEEPCDIKIVPNPTTTSTSTLPITTTTSTSSTSSTTTTSTSSSTTTTTTTQSSISWNAGFANTGPSAGWLWNACNNPDETITIYTANNVISPFPQNTPIYTDSGLTTLLYPSSTVAISILGFAYTVINGYTNPLGGSGQDCQFITTTTTTTLPPTTTTTTTTLAPINPGDIAGLWGWYKGDAGVIGGAQVTSWTDQSILGNDLLTELTAYPEAVTDTVGTLSTTVVRKVNFATLANMATVANFPNTNSTGSCIFIVCKVITSPDILQYVVKAPNIDIYTNTTPAMNSTIGGGATLTQTVSYNTYYTFRSGTDLTDEYFSVNNATPLTSPDAAGFYLARKFRIFAQNGPGTFPSEQGDVAFAEIIVYNTSLTPTEILGVETYLRNKYNHY